jgi:phosphate transport system substrate-binding protein
LKSKINRIHTWWLPLTLILSIGLMAAVAGCAKPAPAPTPPSGELSGTFNIIGSNTVTPLSTVWAEEFMKIHPKVNIAVSGPGSGAGIAALINGTTDICQASRKIKAKEIDQAKANGVTPYETTVALDALSVAVHPSNPVSELTFAQLSAIYTNQVTSWREVGGSDAPIVVISRDTNSGTHVFFKEHVVQMQGLETENKDLEYGTEVLFLPSTEQGVTEVANNPNAIFYPGLGYVTDAVKLLAIKKTADDPAVLPSVETALDGSYPVARPLLYYTNGEPTDIIKAFVDYCLSAEGQQMVTDVGYVPLE